MLSVMLSTCCSFIALHRATLDSAAIVTSPSWGQETPQVPLSPSIHSTNNTQPLTLIRYRQSGMPYFLREAMSQGNMLCRDVAEQQNKTRDTLPLPPLSPIQYSLQLECQKLFYQNSWGTGNVLQAFYGLRLAARVLGNIEVRIRCKDAEKTKSDLVLPWMAGAFVPRAVVETQSSPFLNETCLPFSHAPVHYLMDEIRYELRRMAIALVGIPYPTHPAADFVLVPEREQEMQLPMPETPLRPNIELDDVAIHFRCGDIIEVQPHYAYGYTRFSSVANYISSEARSIGIVTQPFQGQRQRRMDGTEHTRCPILIGAFQQFLQDRFPNATVLIRNSPDENVALSYARFIMANQSLASGISTFVYFPFMATFGTGYLQKPLYVEESFEERVNSRFIEHSDLMSSIDLFRLWNETNGREQILEWFTTDVTS
ncbi:hypothetical protein FisN_19Lh039 [Fistulifera solaris]|uniref:Uncharacterized protein n=1 Tax=Fistulifera solaris TaxID=1519565 RepID=A0A1Z5JRR8_FISSO|nr:hypothetical protein FisN_19Lh039 [Fistulifera solaris]|eukprot:GAX16461.1 hypothetical protein FisN_19Lh039 [Fistulifera solaris]